MKQNRFQKILALIIAVSMISALSACGNDKKTGENTSSGTNSVSADSAKDDTVSIVEFEDDDEETADTTTTTTKGTTTTTAKKTTTKAAPKRDNSYKVTSKTYETEDGKIKISYPQISGLYDADMQNYYNKLFKSDFAEFMSGKSKDSFECQYKVTLKNADILSIVFRCSGYSEGAAYPSGYAYAYNIDLETGGTLVPSAAIDMDSAAKNFLSGKNWTLTRAVNGVSKSDVIEFYNMYDAGQIKEYITESDVITVTRSKKGKYSVDGTVACRSYLDGSSDPIFILDVSHALGDYVEIEFK